MRLRGRIFLKPSRDGPVRGGNPWIFSQAIARCEPPDLAAGDGVELVSADGEVLGFGYYNPRTTIAVRMLAFDDRVSPDAIVAWRVDQAIAMRACVIDSGSDCYRLINGDGDALSGVVADRYNDVIVLQLLTAGAEQLRDELCGVLMARIGPRTIVERSQGAVRRQEGLEDRVGLVAGMPVSEVIAKEAEIRVKVDLIHGQKTGYFLDQRENRIRLRRMSHGARVLDAYCYSGGFAMAAIAGGAREVVAIDTSARALAWARSNFELNQFDPTRCVFIQEDVLKYLGTSAEPFDRIVLDPPPLARSARDAERAGHLYFELNRAAITSLARGGSLLTFSCSSHFTGDAFVRAVHLAAKRARRNLRLVSRLGPAPDHPVLLGHPEGEYLTGLWLIDLG